MRCTPFPVARMVWTLALAVAIAGCAAPAAAQDDRIAAEDLIPAVVMIVVTDCPAAEDPADDDPDLIEAVIDTDDGDCDTVKTGSGVVIDPSGLILTDGLNLFGSEGADDPSGRGEWRWLWIGVTDEPRAGLEYRYLARPVAYDSDLDLGLAQIAYDDRGREVDPDELDLTALSLAADTEGLRIGDPLRAISYPETNNYRVVVIEVRVAGYAPDFLDPDAGEGRMLTINPPTGYGDVGGPVVDDDGEVVGLIAGVFPSPLDCWEQDGDEGIDPVIECKGTPVAVSQVRPVDQIHPFVEEALADLADQPDAREEGRQDDEDDACRRRAGAVRVLPRPAATTTRTARSARSVVPIVGASVFASGPPLTAPPSSPGGPGRASPGATKAARCSRPPAPASRRGGHLTP